MPTEGKLANNHGSPFSENPGIPRLSPTNGLGSGKS
jgi:hypothetical protein